MLSSPFIKLASVFCALSISLTWSCGAVQALTCSKLTESQTRQAVNSFKSRPSSILERYPDGDYALGLLIEKIVSADPNGTSALAIDLLITANANQKRSIARGLALASRQCMYSSQSDIAQHIQGLVRQRGDQISISAFNNTNSQSATGGKSLAPVVSDVHRRSNMLGQTQVARPESNIFREQNIFDPRPHF